MNRTKKLNTSLHGLVSNIGSEKDVSVLLDNQVISPLYGYRVGVERDRTQEKKKKFQLKILNPENREYRVHRVTDDFLFLSNSFHKEFPFTYVIVLFPIKT